jgi:hypothetical protein
VRRVVTGDIVKGKTEEGVLLGGRRMAWVGGLDIRSRPYIGRTWTGGWDTASRVCGVRRAASTRHRCGGQQESDAAVEVGRQVVGAGSDVKR